MKPSLTQNEKLRFEQTLHLKDALERLYFHFNRRKYVFLDPLEFLYLYEDVKDREIAGIVASSLAFGKVENILKNVWHVLRVLGEKPSEFLLENKPSSIQKALNGFKHRWIEAEGIVALLDGIKLAIEEFGSLNRCFLHCLPENSPHVLIALAPFASALRRGGNQVCSRLIPNPELGSACKRLNLFLRWMVRKDDVDPGGWTGINPSMLIIPLDTHMHKISLRLGLTKRRQADMRTALEITRAFKQIAPSDPVRYDFALTRLGIHPEARGMLDPFLGGIKGCSV